MSRFCIQCGEPHADDSAVCSSCSYDDPDAIPDTRPWMSEALRDAYREWLVVRDHDPKTGNPRIAA